MSNPNNSTELGGREELNVVLSDDFAKFDAGFIIVTTDRSVKKELKTVATMKLKGNVKDMKPAGKLKNMTPEKKKERESQKSKADER